MSIILNKISNMNNTQKLALAILIALLIVTYPQILTIAIISVLLYMIFKKMNERNT